MGWVRTEDTFPRHPKVLRAGPLGLAMHIAGMCYCSQYLTDGFVPNAVTNTLLDWTGIAFVSTPTPGTTPLWGTGDDVESWMVVSLLVDAGLWEECDGGYQIHDYLDYNPSREHVMAQRLATATRQKRHKERVSNTDSNGVTHIVTHADGNGVSNDDSLSHSLNEKERDKSLSKKPRKSPAATPLDDQRFETIWQSYPKSRRLKKADCLNIWRGLHADDTLYAEIVAGLDAWKVSSQWQDERFVVYIERWLRDRRWENAPPPPTPLTPRNRNPLAALVPDDYPDEKGYVKFIPA